VWLLLGLAGLVAGNAGAASVLQDYPASRSFFPHADRFGEIQGEPPAAPVYQGDKVVGYLFVTRDIAPIPAYSGKPVNMLVGIDSSGKFTGVKVLEHHEPILLVGIPELRLKEFVGQYLGKPVTGRIKVGGGKREGYANIDAISGATVTVMVMNETLLRAARKVAVSRGIIEPSATESGPTSLVKTDYYQPADWKQLLGNGAIRRLYLTRGEVDRAFRESAPETRPEADETTANDTFIDLYYTYLNAPTIGRNLLGDEQYDWLMGELKPGEHAVAVMANGLYSFKGSGYVRGGIFDRIQLQQNDQEITFRDLDYYRLNDIYAGGAPEFREMGIFVIRDKYRFDPGAPWSLSLLVKRATGPLESAFVSFSSDYLIPAEYVERIAATGTAAEEPIWVRVWYERIFQITVLGIGLLVLTVIMWLQDWLVHFPRVVITLRRGFQLYTLFFIGWYLLGQLSVVNVFAFINSLFSGFSWSTFLIDPTMFILWAFVAGSLLFWGRGVYCGWLCPFGALQKLVNEIAVHFRVRQYNLPQIVHDRLWGIKYLILLVLFGISLQSLSAAERYAEIEPFKTAITLHFMRDVPFVLYAVGLVVVSIFNCKFYCKYLCPLGAALAVPARLRMVDWLRRRKECGKPCQICAKECEIQAIAETGEINPNECHYCLDCQVTYWDDQKCPPLVERRKKWERAMRRAASKGGAADADRASVVVTMNAVNDQET